MTVDFIVQYEDGNRDSKRAAKAYIKRYSESCFDKPVSIIPEQAGDRFKFLQAQGTFVFNRKFSAYYKRKNREHRCATNTLRTTVLQHCHSYCESCHTHRFATLQPYHFATLQAHLENGIFVNKMRPKVITLKFFEVEK